MSAFCAGCKKSTLNGCQELKEEKYIGQHCTSIEYAMKMHVKRFGFL